MSVFFLVFCYSTKFQYTVALALSHCKLKATKNLLVWRCNTTTENTLPSRRKTITHRVSKALMIFRKQNLATNILIIVRPQEMNELLKKVIEIITFYKKFKNFSNRVDTYWS